MSNDLTGPVIMVDSASATDLTVTMFGSRKRVFIKSIRWVAPSAAGGNLAVVTDGDGDIIWKSDAPAAHFTDSDLLEIWSDGLIVPTLATGELFIALG